MHPLKQELEQLKIFHTALADKISSFENALDPNFKPDKYDATIDMIADEVIANSPVMQRHSFDENPSLYAGVQKEWEVVEFRATGKHPQLTKHYTICSNGRFAHPGYYLGLWTEDDIIKGRNGMQGSVIDGDYIIHSVRRISDNTTWTVGEEFRHDLFGHQKITRFRAGGGTQLLVEFSGGSLNIMGIEKPKKSLFTTADGVQVAEGDTAWFFWHITDIKERKVDDGIDCSRHYSTREAAILAHGFFLSLSDLRDRIPAGELEYFVNLVKERSK